MTKTRKVTMKAVPKKKRSFASEREALLDEVDARVQAMFHGLILPVEQRITAMHNELEALKANVITANTLLERKEIIERDEFMEEFVRYGREIGLVDGVGNMDGTPVISLYNVEA